MNHKVAIGKYENFEDILYSIGGIEKFVKKDGKVFIKPNLCAPKSYETGTTTNVHLIEKLILLLQKITKNIIIGDGPIPAFGKLSSASYPEIFSLADKYNIEVIDLNHCNQKKVKSFLLAVPVLKADVVINMPVLKTHVGTGISASLKNMMGIVPFRLKHEMHKFGLTKRIVELAKTFKPHLNIVDATFCQEGDGPTNGTPKKLDLIIIGDNQVAVDSMCCKIMNISALSISHLKLAAKDKLGSLDNIEMLGFESEYISSFKMPSTYKIKLMKFLESRVIRFFEFNNEILINSEKCVRCSLCVKSCPVHALKLENKIIVDKKKCILCFCCHEVCLNNAISFKKKSIDGSGAFK